MQRHGRLSRHAASPSPLVHAQLRRCPSAHPSAAPAPAPQLRRCCTQAAAATPASSSSGGDAPGTSGSHETPAVASNSGASDGPAPARAAARPVPVLGAGLRAAEPPRELSLPFESERLRPKDSPVKTTGLHRAPLSGGVKSATKRYDLPSPPTAVRNLVEHSRFAHLCTVMSGMHHRRSGYPFGTLIDFAADGAGHPFFCLSPLAIHTRNIIEEPRSSLVVQMPGWTGLANARVTIFGDVHQLPPDQQAPARDIFYEKHASERKERWVSGNFVYFRMDRIVDIYFVGGFGTVQWIDPQEYLSSKPDDIVLDNVHRTLEVLNTMFVADLKQLLALHAEPLQELIFISIDATGADIRVRYGSSEFSIERLGFDGRVHNLDQAIAAVKRVVDAAWAARGVIKVL